jgi:hypothetical protein
MTHPTKTTAQKAFFLAFGEEIPKRPPGVSERNWDITLDHAIAGLSYATLGHKYPAGDGHTLSRQRVSEIVEQSIRWAIAEKYPPQVSPHQKTPSPTLMDLIPSSI